VLSQRHPDLEYIVIDGASTDGSRAVIERHAASLTHWVSEKDAGQYDAVNKGFAVASGDILGWINSDDMYTPWAFRVVSEIFAQLPEVEWLTTAFPMMWDARGVPTACHYNGGFSREAFYRGENVPGKAWYATRWVQQESTFWRRSLFERSGGTLDTRLGFAADFDLWARFYETATLYAVGVPLGGFRLHGAQKTAQHLDRYLEEAIGVLDRYGKSRATGFRRHVRRLAARSTPRSLWATAHGLGLVYPRPIIRFDTNAGRWRVHEEYA
jgi:glycosyltransferase involved in cell wall biosynthesis